MQGVYLLHLSPAYKHARHYIGYADDIERRLAEHQSGTGARLTQVAIDAGSELILARTWPGADRTFERRLKNLKNAPCYCPICCGRTTERTVRLSFTMDEITELEF
ncbi:MAG: endonuclease [Caldilinea sp. CFX5]|nr:endonuclease [Caldilinea sp. CFX5]